MSTDTPTCPICKEASNRLFDSRTFRGQSVANVICTRCGFVYQSPRMDAQTLAEFYAQEYRQMYQGSNQPGAKDLLVQSKRAEILLGFIRRKVTAVSRHLDIGCSAGLLLQRVQAAYASQAVGLEPGDTYRAYASQQGLNIYSSIEEMRAAKEPRCDLISMAHVLEHLPDPIGYLKMLRTEWLVPGGWLVVEVPNLYCHDSFEIAHLTAFSPHMLRQVFIKAGYQIDLLEKHGRPRSEFLPLYITVLAHPSGQPPESSIQPEQGVWLKRQIGLLLRAILTRLAPRRAWLEPGK